MGRPDVGGIQIVCVGIKFFLVSGLCQRFCVRVVCCVRVVLGNPDWMMPMHQKILVVLMHRDFENLFTRFQKKLEFVTKKITYTFRHIHIYIHMFYIYSVT